MWVGFPRRRGQYLNATNELAIGCQPLEWEPGRTEYIYAQTWEFFGKGEARNEFAHQGQESETVGNRCSVYLDSRPIGSGTSPKAP